MMVQLRDHDLVGRAPPPAQGPGQVEGQGRHVGPEGHLVGVGIEEVRQARAGRRDDGVRLHAGRVGPVGVRVVMREVVRHGVDDPLRHLGASRPVEVRHRLAGMPAGQGRE